MCFFVLYYSFSLMLHICFVFRLSFQVITPSASSLLIHLSLFPYLINLLPCPQMKPWGRSEYWGLGAEYDPDWVLTEAQKQLRAELIELCRTKIRPRAVSFFSLSLSVSVYLCLCACAYTHIYSRIHTKYNNSDNDNSSCSSSSSNDKR